MHFITLYQIIKLFTLFLSAVLASCHVLLKKTNRKVSNTKLSCEKMFCHLSFCVICTLICFFFKFKNFCIFRCFPDLIRYFFRISLYLAVLRWETAPQHYATTIMLHSWDGVVLVMGHVGINAKKCSTLVSSDQKTFCHFCCRSFTCLFANFKQDSRWTFLRNGFLPETLPYSQDVYNIFDIVFGMHMLFAVAHKIL